MSFSALFVCICVLNYCHRVATQLQLNIPISYHIIAYHIISYHIISYHIIYHIIYIISYHSVKTCKATIPQAKVEYTYFPLHAIEIKCIPTQQITHSSGRRTNMGGHNCNAISLEQLIHLCCLSPL